MRLFVAIELSCGLRRMVAQVRASLAEFDGAVRWVREEQMHLTLKFLGEVAEADVPRIAVAIEQSAAESTPFAMRTALAGCFPPQGRARVVWVGIEDDSGALMACQTLIEEALAHAGFPKEARLFSPHLTLGRVREDQTRGHLRERVAAVEVPTMDQPVDSVVLLQSTRTPAGAQYSRIAKFEMGHATKANSGRRQA